MTGREKCKRLKAIRAALAAKLGIDLHQVECTYEGECTGTCPKCKQEEDALNGAILHKGAAVAGAMMLATSMAACTPLGIGGLNPQGGGGSVETGSDDLSGYVEPEPDNGSSNNDDDIEVLSGEVDEQSLNDDNIDAHPIDESKTVDVCTDDLTGYVG